MSTRNGALAGQKLIKLRSMPERKSPIYVHKSSIIPSFRTPEVKETNLGNVKKEESLTEKPNRSVENNVDTTHKELKGSNVDNTLSIKFDLDKIEETYWSQWKPNKDGVLMEAAKVLGKSNKKGQNKYVLSESNSMDNDNLKYKETIGDDVEVKQQTKLSRIEEVTDEDKELTSSSSQPILEENEHFNFLKHTDSFILNSKKQLIEKPHFQQPRCIRLYKNSSSSSYMRGGSYPLKPCLKKESSFKGNTRRSLGVTYGSNLFKSSRSVNKVKVSNFSQ